MLAAFSKASNCGQYFLDDGIRFIKINSGFYLFKPRSIENARGLALINRLNLVVVIIIYCYFIFYC